MQKDNAIILRNVDFESGFQYYNNNEIRNETFSFFNSHQYQISNKEFSYRIINHWEKNYLLTTVKRDGNGWRKYSVMDRVWLYIIREMRNFEMSLNIINKVKLSLIQKKRDQFCFPYLEYYLSLALLNKPVFLVVFSDGQAHPLTDREIHINREFNATKNHLQINLNHIIQKIFPEKKLSIKYRDTSELSFEEKSAILLLRMDKYKNLEITTHDKNKKLIESGNIDKQEEICNLILKKQYSTLKFTLNTGKVYTVKNEHT